MRLVFLLIAGTALAEAACIAVARDRILVGDLAGIVPFLQAVDPATVVGFAPAPGVQRVFSARELIEFAQGHGLTLAPGAILPSVCVEREAHPLSSAELKAALLASIAIEGAQVELLEYSLQPAPAGKLDFPLTGLNQPPPDASEAPVIWRGRLIYDERRSVSLWAKVRIRIPQSWLVARDAIRSGSIIRVDQIRELPWRPFPLPSAAAISQSDVIGKIARRDIAAGQAFFAGALELRREVNRGDRIQVRVAEGLAVLSFEAEAETSGAAGETVLVKNPASGRTFRARVEGLGQVSVHCLSGASQ